MNSIWKQVAWTSVTSAVLAVVSIISAFAGKTDLVLAFGFASISAGLLSTRE